VQKHFSVDLPEGIIVNLKVVNEEALGKILKEVWKKVGLREKSVGIIIPESSTYTKLLTLPKLPSADLDEAVRWQAYEYLPHKKDDLILDWKIINKFVPNGINKFDSDEINKFDSDEINKFDSDELKDKDEEIKVLVVAVLKEVLGGYVRSAHLADLFPLVVETPSLSLVRFSDAKELGSLFIHESDGVAIIMISQGQSIAGSSTLKVDNQEEVLKVAYQMIRHYKEVPVERVVVGGSNITSELVNKLKQTLAKEPVFIKQAVTGIDASLFQEYMIPISLQLKDPEEPADETTVNLLPLELVKKYEMEKIKHQIWSLSLFVSLIVWISFFTTLGVYLFIGMQINSIRQEDILKQIPPEKAEYISQVEEINEISTKVLSVTSSHVYPETIINAISEARPIGVNILRYRISLETGAIELIGNSQTRELLIDFKDNLEENIDFSLVHIPISSFEKESNLDYVADFSYLPIAGVKSK
jgi:Tfp pilus assembly PilM family ATPase